MPFESFHASEAFKIPRFPAPGIDIFGRDIASSHAETKSPLTAYYFLLENCNGTKAPHYKHDETGILLQGELTLTDETGSEATLKPGDTFFIRAGSIIEFKTASYGLAFKTGVRFGLPQDDPAKPFNK